MNLKNFIDLLVDEYENDYVGDIPIILIDENDNTVYADLIEDIPEDLLYCRIVNIRLPVYELSLTIKLRGPM